MRALRAVMAAVALVSTAALLLGLARGGTPGPMPVLTLLPLWAVAGYADWRLSGRWNGIYGALLGSRR